MLDISVKELVEESTAPKKIERIKFGLFSVILKFSFWHFVVVQFLIFKN
jgi:hypothetical protein